jgi:hypothetical protein
MYRLLLFISHIWNFEIVLSPESNIPSIHNIKSMMVLAYAISMLHNFLP